MSLDSWLMVNLELYLFGSHLVHGPGSEYSLRAVETWATQHHVYKWCVVAAIFMDRFLPRGSTQTSFAATSCRTAVHQRQERRNSRSQLRHAGSRPACSLRPISLRLSCFSVWCSLSLGLDDESSPVQRHSSECALFKVSLVGFHNTCSLIVWSSFSYPLGFTSVGVALLSPRTCKLLDETVQLRVDKFSIVTTIACCPFHEARATFTIADGKMAKYARCCPLRPSSCFARAHGFTDFLSPLSLFCNCLAHAFVWSMSPVFSAWQCVHPLLFESCHSDSLTRGRLAIVQEADRVLFLSFWTVDSACDDLFPVISDRNVSSSVAEIRSSCSYVTLFFVSPCPSLHVSALFLTICSGYAWARSTCGTSWCVECAFHHYG